MREAYMPILFESCVRFFPSFPLIVNILVLLHIPPPTPPPSYFLRIYMHVLYEDLGS